MVRPKDEGGITLRDLHLLNIAYALKRIARIWTTPDSIWVAWIRKSYVKEKALTDINKNKNDSQI